MWGKDPIPRTWRILALFSGDRRHGDPQKVSGDDGENDKLTRGLVVRLVWVIRVVWLVRAVRLVR